MNCLSDTGQNKSITAELFKVCWFGGAEAVFTAEQRKEDLSQVASFQTKGIRPSDHGRGHTFSLHLCCNLLPVYPIHSQSPIHLLLAASMEYFFMLLFSHLCFSFTSKLMSSSPSFCWLVRAQRKEQVLRKNCE